MQSFVRTKGRKRRGKILTADGCGFGMGTSWLVHTRGPLWSDVGVFLHPASEAFGLFKDQMNEGAGGIEAESFALDGSSAHLTLTRQRTTTSVQRKNIEALQLSNT